MIDESEKFRVHFHTELVKQASSAIVAVLTCSYHTNNSGVNDQLSTLETGCHCRVKCCAVRGRSLLRRECDGIGFRVNAKSTRLTRRTVRVVLRTTDFISISAVTLMIAVRKSGSG